MLTSWKQCKTLQTLRKQCKNTTKHVIWVFILHHDQPRKVSHSNVQNKQNGVGRVILGRGFLLTSASWRGEGFPVDIWELEGGRVSCWHLEVGGGRVSCWHLQVGGGDSRENQSSLETVGRGLKMRFKQWFLVEFHPFGANLSVYQKDSGNKQ